MAKAKPGLALASSLPAPDSSTRHPSASPSSSSNRVNRAPRSRPRYSSPSAVLGLLATLSASPLPANGYPLESSETDFPFLYPSLFVQATPSLAKRSEAPSPSDTPSSTTPTPPTSPSGCPQDRSSLPDRYVLGDDGLWHKTKWSLYGSLYCPGPCSPPSSAAGMANNDVNAPPGACPGSNPPVVDDFDTSTLPTGWNNLYIDASSRHGTVLLLVLSVSLAAIIFAMIFSCVFWNRKKPPKRDPEKRWRVSSATADDDDNRSIREAKAAQRKWYKAASRWRDNVRFAARRRRTNRALAPITSYATLPQEERRETATDTEGTIYRSRSSSPTPTQRSVTPTHPDVRASSTASIHSSHSQIQTPRVLASQALPIDTPPSSPVSAQPPAYHRRSSFLLSSPPHDSSEFMYSDRSPSSTSKDPLSFPAQPRPHGDDDSHLTSLSGHVATDDKEILSLRAALASAPPGFNSNFPQSVSVPSMEDEDMFEFPSGSSPPSPTHDTYGYEPQPPYSPPTTLLPPPPSKGKQMFDYSHDWDISVNVDDTPGEPELGPSAPPFEESEVVPSAPPLDFDSDLHVPSAPPVNAEDCPSPPPAG